jgi:restriction system protein
MTVWLNRAGKHGEFEQKLLQENRIYLTWEKLASDLSRVPDRETLFAKMTPLYPDVKTKAIQNYVGQAWPFAH